MSQRTFTASGGYQVLTGWDRPLQRFFLVIETKEQNHPGYQGDDYAFSNLNLPNPAMSIDQIYATLYRFKIMPPPTLFDDLEEDKRDNVGNFVFDYGEWPKYYTD
jgi:hypothetical protein